MNEGYAVFRGKLLKMCGWDLNAYKTQQLERRLRALLSRTRVQSLAQYASLLDTEPERIREVSDLLTINVSEFFRNPERYVHFEKNILPLLPSECPQVWSAGCSDGSEPYTLSIILKEAGIRNYSILATDIDLNILDAARNGVYLEKSLNCVPHAYRDRFFDRVGSSFGIKSSVKEHVRFQKHNLLSDKYPVSLDLIVCRNVLIYFTESAKASIISKFHRSLKPGGFLFLGSTETIFNSLDHGFRSVSPFFYQKE